MVHWLALLTAAWLTLPGPDDSDGRPSQLLQYRLQAGQVLRYEGNHQLSIQSTVSGTSSNYRMQTAYLRQWKVLRVDQSGDARLTMTLVRVRVEATTPDGGRIAFDTEKDTQTPVSAIVGKPLVELTLTRSGQVRDVKQLQQGTFQQFVTGLPTLFCPMPDVAVAVGTGWQRDVRLQLPSPLTAQEVTVRQTFKLAGLNQSVAAIELKTEPATAVGKAVLTQLAQFLTTGTYQFDVAAGLLRRQSMTVDQVVEGFAGKDSKMHVTGKFEEHLAAHVARSPAARPQ